MLVARKHAVVGHFGDVPASEVGELAASEAVPATALEVRSEVGRVVDDLRQIAEPELNRSVRHDKSPT